MLTFLFYYSINRLYSQYFALQMSVNVQTCFRNFCFSRFHHLRHSHDHASAVAGGVHRGHDRALLGHHQPVHRNPQDPRQDQQEVNTIHEDRKKEIKKHSFLFS